MTPEKENHPDDQDMAEREEEERPEVEVIYDISRQLLRSTKDETHPEHHSNWI